MINYLNPSQKVNAKFVTLHGSIACCENELVVRTLVSRIQAYENDIQILKLCVKYGVEIMLGSDAHREEDVGDFTRTEKILKEVDFPEELIVNRSLSYVKNRLRV